jgi:hypothetical protein
MSGAAERRAARGRKKKNMSPVFQGKKTKNLRSRVFLATLARRPGNPASNPITKLSQQGGAAATSAHGRRPGNRQADNKE